MSLTDVSRLPRAAAAELNPMIGEVPADTLHGAADILVMLSDMIWELSPDTTGKGMCGVIEAVRFAIRYEADALQRASGAAVKLDWPRLMAAKKVASVRAKLILMLLAADADADGQTNAAPPHLAARSGMSEAKALSALRWLEQHGLIDIESEPRFEAVLLL